MFNKRATINMQTGWLGVLSDIHANLEALKAVLNDLEALGIDRFITLGDVVGYGPNPGECLELVREGAIFNLAGNHDRAVAVGEGVDEMSRWARESVLRTREQLSTEDLEYLGNLPLEFRAGPFHFVHGSPHDPDRFNYVLTLDQVRQALAATAQQVVLVGHSHIPAVYKELEYRRMFAGWSHRVELLGLDAVRLDPTKRFLINVGSVGQPRDNDPRACYGLFELESRCFSLRRVSYGLKTASGTAARVGRPGEVEVGGLSHGGLQ